MPETHVEIGMLSIYNCAPWNKELLSELMIDSPWMLQNKALILIPPMRILGLTKEFNFWSIIFVCTVIALASDDNLPLSWICQQFIIFGNSAVRFWSWPLVSRCLMRFSTADSECNVKIILYFVFPVLYFVFPVVWWVSTADSECNVRIILSAPSRNCHQGGPVFCPFRYSSPKFDFCLTTKIVNTMHLQIISGEKEKWWCWPLTRPTLSQPLRVSWLKAACRSLVTKRTKLPFKCLDRQLCAKFGSTWSDFKGSPQAKKKR